MKKPLRERTHIKVRYDYKLVPPWTFCWFTHWLQNQGLNVNKVDDINRLEDDEFSDVTVYQQHDTHAGWTLRCWFKDDSQAVLFKLTWGGK